MIALKTTFKASLFAAIACLLIFAATAARGADQTRVVNEQANEWREKTELGDVVVKRIVSFLQTNERGVFDLTISAEKPIKLRLAPNDLEGVYGDFDLEYLGDRRSVLANERDKTERKWRVYYTSHGELKLPPIPLRFETDDPNNELGVVVAVPQTSIAIDDPQNAIQSIEQLQYDLRPIRRLSASTLALIALGGALFLIAAFYFLSKRKSTTTKELQTKPSPYEEALIELNALKESRDYLTNAFAFYVKIDDILRRYLSREFGLNASERTSSEIIDVINAGDVDALSYQEASEPNVESSDAALSREEQRKISLETLKKEEIVLPLTKTLSSLDLIKFARQATSFEKASEIFSTIRKLVDQAAQERQTRVVRAKRELAIRLQLDATKQTPNVDVVFENGDQPSSSRQTTMNEQIKQ